MTATRPRQLVCIAGTHTEVGKTWAAAQLLARARTAGLRVAARKPVQSFDSALTSTDAVVLAEVSGESVEDVCPSHRCYPLALAPPMAADLLHRPRIRIDDLMSEIHWPANIDLGLIESVGGLLSPLAHDADSIDLIRRVQPDHILLVADAGLGTLNAVRLALACLQPLGATGLLNRFDDGNELHRLNRQWLESKYKVRAVTSVAAAFELMS